MFQFLREKLKGLRKRRIAGSLSVEMVAIIAVIVLIIIGNFGNIKNTIGGVFDNVDKQLETLQDTDFEPGGDN